MVKLFSATVVEIKGGSKIYAQGRDGVQIGDPVTYRCNDFDPQKWPYAVSAFCDGHHHSMGSLEAGFADVIIGQHILRGILKGSLSVTGELVYSSPCQVRVLQTGLGSRMLYIVLLRCGVSTRVRFPDIF